MQVFVIYVLCVSVAANELFWTHDIFDVMEVRVPGSTNYFVRIKVVLVPKRTYEKKYNHSSF